MNGESNSPILSIVSVNYLSSSLIHEKEAEFSEGPECEFIVVDNSGEFEATHARTVVVKSPGNIGFGSACNAGAHAAHGQMLAFVNPDADIDLKQQLDMARCKLDTGKGIFGPAIYDHHGTVRSLFEPGRFGLRFRRGIHMAEALSSDEIEVPYVSGACMLVRADFFQELGGFYEGIFLYAEDLELCLRAKRAGGEIVILPAYRAYHRGGRSTTKLSPRLKRFGRSYLGHFRFLKRLGLSSMACSFNAAHLATGIRV